MLLKRIQSKNPKEMKHISQMSKNKKNEQAQLEGHESFGTCRLKD